MRINFTKMAGAGNDFIVVDNRSGLIRKNIRRIAKKLSNRRFSIGADGLVLLEKSKTADIRMRLWNPDGSEAEMCGNGVRCLAKFAVDKHVTGSKLSIETPAGTIYAEVKGLSVKAKMIAPKDLKLNFRIGIKGRKELLNFINTGVPHAVKLVGSVDSCDVLGLGETIRHHDYFAPRGTNVDFVSLRKGSAIDIRTYERGVEGETLACGTGSTAAALVTATLKNLKSPVSVHTHGGEVLKVYFSKRGMAFHEVYLEGRIQCSFEGGVKI
ncbi:MAG: diaminopimelate epimerase [Candidatus Omnitrophica bacterium CG1_02_46_14]|nr:MAG: diaminopimelate epimerase [Candidatus Omnitrophica bacterium CG1_02_46_14]